MLSRRKLKASVLGMGLDEGVKVAQALDKARVKHLAASSFFPLSKCEMPTLLRRAMISACPVDFRFFDLVETSF
jgi:hypothetical protein